MIESDLMADEISTSYFPCPGEGDWILSLTASGSRAVEREDLISLSTHVFGKPIQIAATQSYHISRDPKFRYE
jgi:hypothetical protein